MQPSCCALQPPESRCGCTTSRVAAPSYVELGSCSPVRIQLMHSRRPFRFLGSVIVAVAATLGAPRSRAQVPPRPAQATPAGRDGERAPDYPVRPPAPPEQVAHSTLDILVGDAKHGEAYFNGAGRCTQCHSATGDLAGIGSRYEPKTIQNLIVSGGGGRGRRRSAGAAPPVKPPPTTVTVTLPSGRRVQGELDHLSAFVVALRDSAGTYHSFARHDSIPK